MMEPVVRAFPSPDVRGMSLRDWFAGQALTAIDAPPLSNRGVALWAYGIADAMMAVRDEAPSTGE